MKKLFLIFTMLLVGNFAFAGFMPENDMNIGADQKLNSMTEAEFDRVIDRIEEIYTPVVAAKGKTLNIIRDWQDGTVNAYAVQKGNVWEVKMFGGMARHALNTSDGFATVLCHEMGHHMGGAPHWTDYFGRPEWAASEGQSDYFATSKCMKLFIGWDEEQDQEQNQDLIEKTKCDSVYQDQQSEICQRIANAGLALGKVLGSMRSITPSLDTPDTSVVTTSITTGYPSVQCRVDTYFMGALCATDPSSDTSVSDSNVGYECNGSGPRPSCWFNDDTINSNNDMNWPWEWPWWIKKPLTRKF